jgi:hypothetical protein
VYSPRVLIVTFLVAAVSFGQNAHKSPAWETSKTRPSHFPLEPDAVASAQEPMGVGGLDSLLIPIHPRQINTVHAIPLSQNLEFYLRYIAPTENEEHHPAPPRQQTH